MFLYVRQLKELQAHFSYVRQAKDLANLAGDSREMLAPIGEKVKTFPMGWRGVFAFPLGNAATGLGGGIKKERRPVERLAVVAGGVEKRELGVAKGGGGILPGG